MTEVAVVHVECHAIASPRGSTATHQTRLRPGRYVVTSHYVTTLDTEIAWLEVPDQPGVDVALFRSFTNPSRHRAWDLEG